MAATRSDLLEAVASLAAKARSLSWEIQEKNLPDHQVERMHGTVRELSGRVDKLRRGIPGSKLEEAA